MNPSSPAAATATNPLDTKIADKHALAANPPAKNKPLLHSKLFPVNVSYFAQARTTKAGEPFTAHDFSISVFRGEDDAGEAIWDSLSIRRSEAPKLIAALQNLYHESYQVRPAADDE